MTSFILRNRLDGCCKGINWNRGTEFMLTILTQPIKEIGRSDHLLRYSDAGAKIRLVLQK